MGFLPSEIQYQIFFGSIHPEGPQLPTWFMDVSHVQVSVIIVVSRKDRQIPAPYGKNAKVIDAIWLWCFRAIFLAFLLYIAMTIVVA